VTVAVLSDTLIEEDGRHTEGGYARAGMDQPAVDFEYFDPLSQNPSTLFPQINRRTARV
jgi:hypothetical protein